MEVGDAHSVGKYFVMREVLGRGRAHRQERGGYVHESCDVASLVKQLCGLDAHAVVQMPPGLRQKAEPRGFFHLVVRLSLVFVSGLLWFVMAASRPKRGREWQR